MQLILKVKRWDFAESLNFGGSVLKALLKVPNPALCFIHR